MNLSRTGRSIRCAALGVALVFAGTALSGASIARAQGSRAVTSCRTSQVRETLKTSARSYPVDATVKMTLTIHNESTVACTVAIGPTSPSLTVINAKGVVVWNNCYAHDRPGACAQFMMLHIMSAQGSYTFSKTWNQRSGSVSHFVPRGTYTLTSNYYEAGSVGTYKFTLTA